MKTVKNLKKQTEGIENCQNEIIEIKNTIIELNNSIEGFNGSQDQAE
jgi:hypothetical protein